MIVMKIAMMRSSGDWYINYPGNILFPPTHTISFFFYPASINYYFNILLYYIVLPSSYGVVLFT